MLVDFFSRLPHRVVRGSGSMALGEYDEREAGRSSRSSVPNRLRGGAAIETFRKKVGEKYNEGTLLRLLKSGEVKTRRAAAFTLGLLGTMENANAALADALHDEDNEVRRLAGDALWSLWFGGDSPECCRELRRVVRLKDRQQVLSELDRLIARAPLFAEAYNQRAIVQFRLQQYEKSVADCERVLQLNPHHFGAQAGLGQCYLHLRKHKAALKAFRAALRINPRLDGVAATVRAIEKALGEEGR
jgi:tetratricopeptide (TPR) repeat protein